MGVAEELDCVLKLLIPCQLVDNRRQEDAVQAIGGWLLAEDFSSAGVLDHITWYIRDGFMVRVQRPWCPVYCQALAGRKVTVRITASGEIRSCLREAGRSFGSVLRGVPELREGLSCAIWSAGHECFVAPRSPRIVVRSRKQLSTDELSGRGSINTLLGRSGDPGE